MAASNPLRRKFMIGGKGIVQHEKILQQEKLNTGRIPADQASFCPGALLLAAVLRDVFAWDFGLFSLLSRLPFL